MKTLLLVLILILSNCGKSNPVSSVSKVEQIDHITDTIILDLPFIDTSKLIDLPLYLECTKGLLGIIPKNGIINFDSTYGINVWLKDSLWQYVGSFNGNKPFDKYNFKDSLTFKQDSFYITYINYSYKY